MNKALIANWNSVVGHDDTVYHLGDVGFKARRNDMVGIMAALNGTKILIRGNHDKGVDHMYGLGFAAVLEKAVIQHCTTKYLLQHYPIRGEALRCILEDNEFDGLIHGHVHNNDGPEIFNGFAINVSAEVIDYTPIDIDTLHKMFRQHCIKNGLFLNV
jgi:calcineurin-like phosphoesterase family protein